MEIMAVPTTALLAFARESYIDRPDQLRGDVTMRPWARWSSGLACAALAVGIAQAQNSAFSDGTPRTYAPAIA